MLRPIRWLLRPIRWSCPRCPGRRPSQAILHWPRSRLPRGDCILLRISPHRGGKTGRARYDLAELGSVAVVALHLIKLCVGCDSVKDLEDWIRNPQRIKEGVNMPAHPLPDDDLKALVAYLGTLK